MKRGSQIGLAVSVIFLLAAGVTNMCSAVAREESSSSVTPAGRAFPRLLKDEAWLRANRDLVMRTRRRMEAYGERAGYVPRVRAGTARVMPVAVSLLPGGARAPRHVFPRVSLTVTAAPVADVLRQLFSQAKVPYAIDPRVCGKVTYHGDDVPFQLALEQVVSRAAPAVSLHVRDGVYAVGPRDGNLGIDDVDLVAYGE